MRYLQKKKRKERKNLELSDPNYDGLITVRGCFGYLYVELCDFEERNRVGRRRRGSARAITLDGVRDEQLHDVPVPPPVRRELGQAPHDSNQSANAYMHHR